MSVRRFACAALIATLASAAYAQPPDTKEAVGGAVQMYAMDGRLGADFCKFKPAVIEAYKQKSREEMLNVRHDVDFDANWKIGWDKAQQAMDGYTQLGKMAPQRYEEIRKETCDDLGNKMGAL